MTPARGTVLLQTRPGEQKSVFCTTMQFAQKSVTMLLSSWKNKIVYSKMLHAAAAAAAKQLQSCPTLCDPIDSRPPGCPVPGILQARTLEWVAIFFSNSWKWKVKVKLLSRVRLLVTPWLQPTRLLHPWDFPGKSTGVECHCLLRISTLGPLITLSPLSHEATLTQVIFISSVPVTVPETWITFNEYL